MKIETRAKTAGLFAAAALLLIVLAPTFVLAQGTLADYQRGAGMQAKARGLVVDTAGNPNWIEKTNHFWYSKSVKGGTEFVLVDATAAVKRPAFDHEKLAAAITAAGVKCTALQLPFAPAAGGRGGGGGRGLAAPGGAPQTAPLNFVDQETAITFGAGGFMYKCTLADYKCSKGAAIPQTAAPGRGGRGDTPEPAEDDLMAAPPMVGGDPVDGLEYLAPAPQEGGFGGAGRGNQQQPCAPRRQGQTPAQGFGQGRGAGGGRGTGAGQTPAEPQVCGSFDGKWEAIIENYNVFLRATGPNAPATPLSFDGSEGNYYTFASLAWSPDSTKLVAYHTRPGYDRRIQYVESSPADQVQPKTRTSNLYRKPGDALDIAFPALFDVATKKQVDIDPALFPNAYSLSRPVWWRDGRAFTFEYNQRGHQVYRVIEVDARSGKPRALISEESKTFIYYNELGNGTGLSAGRRYRRDLNDGREIIWASERDGWEHLYLYDGVTGNVKNQITKGEWLVRGVESVDEAKRQIYFYAGGMIAGQDPYFAQMCRINFDGTGLVKLTEADGTHTATFSPDRRYYVDSWQRVNLPPVAQVRSTEDQKVLLDLESGDASALLAAGFKYPEVFVAKGRDGKTDIWGTIVRPMNLDPARKYPVIEQIYAGPQGSFVPKTFSAVPGTQQLAELGFIVVQIDGMGTSNRSKAFHDVCWKNLGDAGFPDRILWIKAAAAKYPYMDITRVGIYGTSAGGQNSMGGVLFHPEFYKVVVTNSGCHDNRMDKIWWNEQWMGWPLGPHYAASSNVDNADKLVGKALIIIPELDTNVDPSSSMQVVNALIRARKHVDMLVVPNTDHGAGAVGQHHYLQDYFVHNLLGVEPPDWNRIGMNVANPDGN